MKNFLLKTMSCALLLASINSALLAQTDSTAESKTESKTTIRRAVERVFGEHPKEIPQGRQHTLMLQAVTYYLGVGYDMRFRTDNRHFDLATQVGISFYDNNYVTKTNKSRLFTCANIGISGLWGKRAFSFEMGLQAKMYRIDREELVFLDYKTEEETWVHRSSTNFQIGVPIGMRFQPVTGGLFFTETIAPSFRLYGVSADIRIGLGYTFPTKRHK